MKILIIGGTGFIGRHLKEYFLKTTDFNILTPTRKELYLVEFSSCYEYLKTNQPDIVIHSAVNINSVEDSIAMFFNIIRCHSFFGKFLNLGSGAEYNPTIYTPKMTEEKSLVSYPDKGYSLSKFVQGREIEYGPLNNLTNIRLFGVYGEYEDFSRRFISNNICRVLSGLKISMNKDMNFDYLYINDLCSIIKTIILKNDLKYKTYNVCSGNPTSLIELAKIIKKVMNVEEEIVVKNSGKNPEYSGNSSKIQKEIGQFNLTPHIESITKMVKYFENEYDINPNMKIIEN